MDRTDLGPAARADRRLVPLPLTSTPARTPERRLLGLLTLAAAVSLTLSACAAVTDLGHRSSDDRSTIVSSTGAVGKQHDHLPSWVPDGATEIRQRGRSTGTEQIVTMRATLDDLPDTCTAVSAENPLVVHPEDAGSDASDFRSVSTLRADWWPVEVEQRATVMCGRWWITAEDGRLYAFTPERRTVPVD